MEFKVFTSEDYRMKYDEFIVANALDGGLLQSWLWGDFKKELGLEPQRFGIFDGDILLMAGTAFLQPFARVFKVLYLPRGPVFAMDFLQQPQKIKELTSKMLAGFSSLAQEKKVLFFRMDPAWMTVYLQADFLAEQGFIKLKRAIQPEHVLVMDLRPGLDNLLAAMKQKTRYNIKRASQKGVEIRISQDLADLPIFNTLMSKTARRHRLKRYPNEYFEKMFKIFLRQKNVYLFIARHQGVDVAAGLVPVFGKTAYYLFGASDYDYRQVMSTYLLHWQIIKKMKSLGCYFYDFGGMAVGEKTNSAADSRERDWEGFSRFKKGFAPSQGITEYVGTFELPYHPRLYKMLQYLR